VDRKKHAFKALNNRMRLSNDEEQVETQVESKGENKNALVWTYPYVNPVHSTIVDDQLMHSRPIFHRKLSIIDYVDIGKKLCYFFKGSNNSFDNKQKII
jgi:hypothetical protein